MNVEDDFEDDYSYPPEVYEYMSLNDWDLDTAVEAFYGGIF